MEQEKEEGWRERMNDNIKGVKDYVAVEQMEKRLRRSKEIYCFEEADEKISVSA